MSNGSFDDPKSISKTAKTRPREQMYNEILQVFFEIIRDVMQNNSKWKKLPSLWSYQMKMIIY